MKKLILSIIILFATLSSMAQVIVECKNVRDELRWGLYNTRTNRWVLDPEYTSADELGASQGVMYWRFCNDRGLWGVVSSENYDFKVAPQYTIIRGDREIFPQIPIICVRKGSDWGLMEIGTPKCYMLKDCKYKNAYVEIDGRSVFLEYWDNPGRGERYPVAAIREMYNNKVEEYKNEKRIQQENEARIQKEKELASFTLYAKKYVTPKAEEWQQKGEFEKILDYQKRVTGANRETKIREWTKEAEDMFIKENAALNPIRDLLLEVYDSESEVFSIKSPKFGQLLVSVPIDEGKEFKTNFDTAIIAQNPVYFIEKDKIALSSLEFYNKSNGKTYYYNNQLALNYTQYEIDLNNLDITPVRITTSSTTSTPPVTQAVKPICNILSPERGSAYSTSTIKLRYVATVDPRTTATVRFYVAGQEVMPIGQTPPAKGTKTKGAVVTQGTEVELPMPQEIGHETPVTLQVVDGFHTWAEPKTITLKYVGEKPKPTLHLFAVGVSDYSSSDLQDLNYAAKDAQDFVNTIKSLDLSRYKEVKQTLILDKEASANYVRTQLNKLVNRVDQEDVVMLFFSGHGINDDDKWYFMTYGIPVNDCVNALDFAFIKEQMKKMSKDKNCHVLIFMDACHSGGMYGQKGYVKDITLSEAGINGFYSSAASKKSREENGNGLFTRALIDGIKGAADIDHGGSISISELREYINKTLKDKGQSPVFDNPGGDYVIFYKKK